METTRRVFRLPVWLDDICEEVTEKVGAKNRSDYLRGVILKHAVTLGVKIPVETQYKWPEWAIKPCKEKPQREPPREIERF